MGPAASWSTTGLLFPGAVRAAVYALPPARTVAVMVSPSWAGMSTYGVASVARGSRKGLWALVRVDTPLPSCGVGVGKRKAPGAGVGLKRPS